MKRVSLANLAVNASPMPPPATARLARGRPVRRREHAVSSEIANKLTESEAGEGGSRVQVAFRMDKDAYKELKRMALDEDATVNELMVRAINELRGRRGLKKL